MNYYNPNFYQNYPYVNQQMAPQYQTPPMAPSPQTLNGKIVDSEDVVRATEVPIGGYGIFPKADLSEIYLKSWNNNGTTSIVTFQPLSKPQVVENQADPNIQAILDKINILETKLDSIVVNNKGENKKEGVAY